MLDPKKASGSGYHAEAWGKPDPKNFHADTSEHFRARVHRKIFDDKWSEKRRANYRKKMSESLERAEATYDVLANRMARQIWAMTTRGELYNEPAKAVAT